MLAPAGSYEACRAAVNAGADAVYMGGPLFSARAYAESSKEDMLLSSIEYCHLRGVRIYMTLNTLMKDGELELIEDYLRPYYEAGLDGVIIQDLGLLKYVKEHFPGLALHASTQMTVTGPAFSKLLRDYGVCRVVPARELSLSEIREIADIEGLEVEVFAHGALCYSYSGQCLMSSLIGGRSGNRGRCAGPCRLPYDGGYILSMKDLNTLRLLPKLYLAGTASLKIEGRMKSPSYVAGVVSVYRKYLDRLYELFKEGGEEAERRWNKDMGPEASDLSVLSEVFDRGGSTEGYLRKQNGRDMLQLKEKPKLRVRDEKLLSGIEEQYIKEDKRIYIRGEAVFEAGSLPRLRLWPEGSEPFSHIFPEVSAEAWGEQEAEAAKSRGLTKEELLMRLKKSGGTDFVIRDISITVNGEVFIPVSQINLLRRKAIDELRKGMLSCFSRGR